MNDPWEFFVHLSIILRLLPLAISARLYRGVDCTRPCPRTCAVVGSGRVPWVWGLWARGWMVATVPPVSLLRIRKKGNKQVDWQDMQHSAHLETQPPSSYLATSSPSSYSSQTCAPPDADSHSTLPKQLPFASSHHHKSNSTQCSETRPIRPGLGACRIAQRGDQSPSPCLPFRGRGWSRIWWSRTIRFRSRRLRNGGLVGPFVLD